MIHSKKINRIIQDINESILNEQKPTVKFSLDNNHPAEISNPFRPKLYGRTHIAPQQGEKKRIELNEETPTTTPKYLSRDASPMNKDDYYLFPKPEKPSAKKLRAKLVDSSPKKLLRENSAK